MNAPSYVPQPNLVNDYNKLKSDLILKNQIIKNLVSEIENLKKNDVVVNNITLYNNLAKKLKEKTLELEETNSRLEALVLVESLNTSITSNGSYDIQELSHKVITKLQLLQQENQTLLKLISFGNKSSLLVELNLLKLENEKLKTELEAKKKSDEKETETKK